MLAVRNVQSHTTTQSDLSVWGWAKGVMSIEVHCNSCGKLYQAPEHLAGKRIKCRQCGVVFEVPSNTDPDDLDQGLNALAAMEESFGGSTTIMHAQQPTDLPVPDDVPMSGPISSRLNVRFSYPGAAVVDRWLPVLLLVGGGLWIALTAYGSDPNQPGLTTARLFVMLCAYLGVVFPMGLRGVHLAARDLGFMLPRTSTFRALATFMPVFVLGSVLWMASGGKVSGLILGVVCGFLVSTGAMWLLFRLQPRELPAAVGYAGGMVGIALGIAGGAMFGMNALLSSALVSMHKAEALPGSPFGMGFSWPKPSTAAIAP